MKQVYYFIDDVIWCLRDVARERPQSIFDQSYFKMLKKCHDEWGLKVQLNLFYRTDFFYGTDEFTLKEMPDCYKAEFEANSDWLKFGFHAKQEFPDYPYVNATYETVKTDWDLISGEVKRFAGEKSMSFAVLNHWLPMSKSGCKALADCGVKYISVSSGPVTEYTGDESVLPYGHAARLRHNRQPETKLYGRNTEDERIKSSICAYNHIIDLESAGLQFNNTSLLDEETGIRFKEYAGGPCLNLNSVEENVKAILDIDKNGVEYFGIGNHEQYFYPEYYAYQPDMSEKHYEMAKTLHDLGYSFITADDFK